MTVFTKNIIKTDIVIVGGGAAGLMAALTAAQAGDCGIVVLADRPLGVGGSSALSQGGLAAAVGAEDSADAHAADTLVAGAGLSDHAAVATLTAAGADIVTVLEDMGLRFARGADGRFALSREACHSARRVLKAAAADGFGRELMRALTARVAQTPQIRVVSGVQALRLLRRDGGNAGPVQGVAGRFVDDGRSVVVAGACVLLATGGIGGLYAVTTNPLTATGGGIAMAARAGALLADMEFVQFHPTALDVGLDPAPLATEALRGEGAFLLDTAGRRFMRDVHPMAELAPRDIVSRAVFTQIMQGARVYLDARHLDTARFPALRAAMAAAGLDPARDLAPVLPAAHYFMGGVAADLAGRSSLAGLWVAGECAATGVHGGNRLASNSLLEAVFMGMAAAQDMVRHARRHPLTRLPRVPRLPPEIADMPEARALIRKTMTEQAGVVRNAAGLVQAIDTLARIEAQATSLSATVADMALVGRLVAQAALARTESRGAHCRSDCPETKLSWRRRSFFTLREMDMRHGFHIAARNRQEVHA